MKLFGVFLIVATLAIYAQAATNTAHDASYLKKAARANGIVDAEKDYSNGVYRIEIYGLPGTGKDPKAEYLKDTYGVKTTPVAGCCVTPQIRGHAEGYNTRMKELLNLKFGKDVFLEAQELWKNGKLKNHPQ